MFSHSTLHAIPFTQLFFIKTVPPGFHGFAFTGINAKLSKLWYFKKPAIYLSRVVRRHHNTLSDKGPSRSCASTMTTVIMERNSICVSTKKNLKEESYACLSSSLTSMVSNLSLFQQNLIFLLFNGLQLHSRFLLIIQRHSPDILNYLYKPVSIHTQDTQELTLSNITHMWTPNFDTYIRALPKLPITDNCKQTTLQNLSML